MKTLKLLIISIFIVLLIASCGLKPENNPEQSELDIDKIWQTIENAPYYEGRLNIGYETFSDVQFIAEKLNAEIVVNIPEINAAGIRFSGDIADKKELILDLIINNDIDFRFIEPSYKRNLVEPLKDPDVLKRIDVDRTVFEMATAATSTIPDLMEYVWGIEKINAPAVWDKGYEGDGIVVAVIDTGIDSTHPDLEGQIEYRYDPILGTEVATKIDYSFGAHGTHVAGTIAAKKDGIGVTGVAPSAKLMDIPIFQSDYIGDEYVAKGIIWAVNNGANILSNSWGGKGYSSILRDAITYAYINNVVFVNSAGNEHVEEISSPKMYPGVIVVAASNAVDGVTYFSSRSKKISVAAPGDYTILSSVPLWDEDEFAFDSFPYAFYGGTSMACPHVSGAIALLMEKHSEDDLNPYQYRRVLELGAVDILEPGFDVESGWGRLDVEGSLNVNTNEIGNGGEVVFETTSKRTYENGSAEYLNGVYITMIPKDSNLPIFAGKTSYLFNDGLSPFIGISPVEYDIYFGSGDSLDPTSWMYYGGRSSEQFGFMWENYEVTEGKAQYPINVEFSSKPKVVVESLNFYTLEGTSMELYPKIFKLKAVNPTTLDKFESSEITGAGNYALPDYAPPPIYTFMIDLPISYYGESFFDSHYGVVKGYIEYNNDAARRVFFTVTVDEFNEVLSDGLSPYFTAF
jgi:subtilisin family serine protease